MIRFVKHNGFTLIETMIALSLMTIFLLSIVSFQHVSTHMVQDAFEQQKARERLQELWMLYVFSPSTFSTSYQKWKTEKQDPLLKEECELQDTTHEMTAELMWSSPTPQWRCHTAKKPHLSCMEWIWAKK